jgi:hypothetical protein
MHRFLVVRAGNSPFDGPVTAAEIGVRREFMQNQDEKDHGKAQAETEDEQVICSNELLAVIRERMKQRRHDERESADREAE